MEDNPADVLLVKEALSEHLRSYTLTVIKDGEKAIQHIDDIDNQTRDCPSLVILDLNLPRRSGQDVLRRLRLSRRCREVPVVILSSSGAEKDREETRSLGATLYITKPTDLAQFLNIGATIRKLIEAAPSGPLN